MMMGTPQNSQHTSSVPQQQRPPPHYQNHTYAAANNRYAYFRAPPPPPRPPRPPPHVSFIRPEVPLPPGVSNHPSSSTPNPPPQIQQQQQQNNNHLFQPPLPPNPVMTSEGSYVPLAPPPLPPLFPYLSQELAQSLHDGATSCGKSFADESTDLPFVPVIITQNDLKKMTENVKTQIEEGNKQKSLLLYHDIIDQTWPEALRAMFQPLYCKLCKLTLTSPVVARDHYKGKKHNRAAEVWMQNNSSKLAEKQMNYGYNKSSGVTTTIHGNVRTIPERGQGQGPSSSNYQPPHNNRNEGPPFYPNQNGFDRSPAPPPPPQKNFKRNAAGNRIHEPEFIPAYRAHLSSPGPNRKRPKKEGGGGLGPGQAIFGQCGLCNVNHTSAVTAEQHYSGRNHKTRLLQLQKTGQYFGDDPRFGIGSDFVKHPSNQQS